MATDISIAIEKIKKPYYIDFTLKRKGCFNEEDLRILFASLISSVSEKSNLKISESRHEYSVFNGRIDSLYGHIILEYKEPNHLSLHNNSPKNAKAIEQVKRHIVGIGDKSKIKRGESDG